MLRKFYSHAAAVLCISNILNHAFEPPRGRRVDVGAVRCCLQRFLVWLLLVDLRRFRGAGGGKWSILRRCPRRSSTRSHLVLLRDRRLAVPAPAALRAARRRVPRLDRSRRHASPGVFARSGASVRAEPAATDRLPAGL